MGVDRYKDFVEQVHAATNIVEVIGRDVDLTSSGSTLKGLSPFRQETNPSFTVWPETQSWCDFSGNGRAGGDVFAYVQKKQGIGFKDAVYLLAENAGIKPPNQADTLLKNEIALLEERREIEKILTKAAEFYHARLPSKIRQNTLQKHYGFSDQTIDDLLLGWADGHLLDYLAKEGLSQSLALKTGLFIVTKNGIKDFFRNRIVFPYWKRGRVVYFIARATEVTGDEKWEQAKYKKQLTHVDTRPYVSPTIQNDYFYNEDAASRTDELLITEGVTDCISAMQAGIPCISPVTTRFRKRDIPKLIALTRNIKKVIICNDNEKNQSGIHGALETAEALHKVGKDVRIATIPLPEGADKIDVNELVVNQGDDALRQELRSAKPLLESLINRIPVETDKTTLAKHLEPILTLLSETEPIARQEWQSCIADRFGIGKRAVSECLKQVILNQRRKRSPDDDSEVPEIIVNGRQLFDIVQESVSELKKANQKQLDDKRLSSEKGAPLLFSRAGCLVQLVAPEDGTIFIETVTKDVAYAILTRIANWVHVNEDDKRNTFPPRDVAQDLVTITPAGLPELEAVITTPVFGKDGNLIDTPGYHETDRLWLQLPRRFTMPEIARAPTRNQIDQAKSLFLNDLFVDFPFVTEGDRAGIFAALLLPFIRVMIQGPTPLHLVEAPKAGSGKGLLCNLVSIVATGAACDAQTLPTQEEEIRKKLTAELAKAKPIILLDNAEERKKLDSSSLASIATSETWTDRILGQSKMITMKNRALWFLTGNNPALSNELTRRCIRIRLDSKLDMPWKREGFKHKDIVGWAKQNRPNLVHAALTLIQAWIATDRPLGEKNLGSFEHWAAVLDGLLQVIGIEGFLDNLDEFYAQADTESEVWREFTAVWWSLFAGMPKKVTELNTLCEKHDMLQFIRGDGTERSQQLRLGKALKNSRDRVYGELQIQRTDDAHSKTRMYFLRRLSQDVGDSQRVKDSESIEAQTLPHAVQRIDMDPFEY